MIQIKTSANARPLTPDGPHDSEGTRAIATGIDAAFRLLNYATSPEKNGLVYPSDVYSVLGELTTAIGKLPQALQQMSQFIGAQVADGAARENPHYGRHGGDAEAAHGELAATVRQASGLATDLARLLGKAQSATAGLDAVK
jgi:hypothetical protein